MIYINCPSRKAVIFLFQCDSFIIKMHRRRRRKSEFVLSVYSTLRANYYLQLCLRLGESWYLCVPCGFLCLPSSLVCNYNFANVVLRVLYQRKLIFTSQLGVTAHNYFTSCYSRKHCRDLTIQSFRRSLNDITITLI